MTKDEITKKFVEVLKPVLNFYCGSKKLQIVKIEGIQILSVIKGDYSDGYNYQIKGVAEFYKSCENATCSNGQEYFDTLIKTEKDEIKDIDRINIKDHC